MSKILVPSAGPDSWRQFLAQPEKQWAKGYSARTLAHAWESSSGFPEEVQDILAPTFGHVELLLAIPEHKTPLPGGRRESQSDVFALGHHANGLIACSIEGKVEEPFGPTVAQQMVNASSGRIERLGFLCRVLGIESCPPDVHYQLLHRTASAVIEADRFCASDAAMIVHSFSPERRWLEAYERFCEVLGCRAAVGAPATMRIPSGKRLVLGWACGEQRFREM